MGEKIFEKCGVWKFWFQSKALLRRYLQTYRFSQCRLIFVKMTQNRLGVVFAFLPSALGRKKSRWILLVNFNFFIILFIKLLINFKDLYLLCLFKWNYCLDFYLWKKISYNYHFNAKPHSRLYNIYNIRRIYSMKIFQF